MDMHIKPSVLRGRVAAIPSKSHLHRLLIAAALADAPLAIAAPLSSRDIEATINCLRALGASIEHEGGSILAAPIREKAACPALDCGESGSTLRFLLPLAALLGTGARFSGSGRLPERPLGPLLAALRQHGVRCSADSLPLTVEGRLSGGEYRLPGNISSQYISGLLLALPACGEDSRLLITTQLESAAYIGITLQVLRCFGVAVEQRPGAYHIPGRQIFRSPGQIRAEGDWSNAAFFLAAGALGGEVTVSGLDPASPQGDRHLTDLLQDFGARVKVDGHSVSVGPGLLRGMEIDISPIPDLLPALSIVAAFAAGETRFINAARLRLKESDRLAATAALIRSLGGAAQELPDALIVRGKGLRGGTADSCNDHRIAMAAALAAAGCAQPVVIRGAEAVNKSYPGFFDDYRSIGGNAHVL